MEAMDTMDATMPQQPQGTTQGTTPEEFEERTLSLLGELDASGIFPNDETDNTPLELCVLLPEKVVPLLIGKAGANVNTTKSATGASVSFAKKERSVHGLRKCFHTGTIQQITRAVAVASAFVAVQAGGPCEVSIVVAHAAAGAVIGKGGENLKMIREMTGCHLNMEKNNEGNPAFGGRCLSLRHPEAAAQVVTAVYRVCRLQGFASLTAAEDRINGDVMAYDPHANYGYGPATTPHDGGKRFSPYGLSADNICAIHGKKRGRQNLQPHPTAAGQFMCMAEDPCKGAVNMGGMAGMGMAGMAGMAGMGQMGQMGQMGGMGMYGMESMANFCAYHGKKRGARNLQPHPTTPGLFVCLDTDTCKGAGNVDMMQMNGMLGQMGQMGQMQMPPAQNICATHGKRRGERNLQPHPTTPGLFVCLEADACKVNAS